MSLSLRGENVNSYTSWWKIYLNRQCFSLSPCGESLDLFTRWWMLIIDNLPYISMSSPIIERAKILKRIIWNIRFQRMRFEIDSASNATHPPPTIHSFSSIYLSNSTCVREHKPHQPEQQKVMLDKIKDDWITYLSSQ